MYILSGVATCFSVIKNHTVSMAGSASACFTCQLHSEILLITHKMYIISNVLHMQMKSEVEYIAKKTRR